MALRYFACVFLLAASASAQTGTFTTFGKACPGTSANLPCASNNANATNFGMIASLGNPQFAIEVTGGVSSPIIMGFDIFTKSRSKSPITLTTEIFLAQSTGFPQAKAVAKGKIVIGTTAGWYRTVLTTPLLLKANTTFFISYQDPAFSPRVVAPTAAPPATRSSHYQRTATTAAWRGVYSLAWAYKINCIGSTSLPTIGNQGRPIIGKSFSILLSKAMAKAPALLMTGFSNKAFGTIPLPFSLASLGANGCSLYQSFDFGVATVTDAQGAGSMLLPIPMDTFLLGGKIHSQWLVADVKANALGASFSDAGTGTIGSK